MKEWTRYAILRVVDVKESREANSLRGDTRAPPSNGCLEIKTQRLLDAGKSHSLLPLVAITTVAVRVRVAGGLGRDPRGAVGKRGPLGAVGGVGDVASACWKGRVTTTSGRRRGVRRGVRGGIGGSVGGSVGGLVRILLSRGGSVRNGNGVAALRNGVCLHLALVAWRWGLDSDVDSRRSLSGALRRLGGIDNGSDDRRLGSNWRLRRDWGLRRDRGLRSGRWVDDNLGGVCGRIVRCRKVSRIDGRMTVLPD